MKKKLLKVGIALAVIIAISVALFFVFKALGITNIDTLRFTIYKAGAWGKVVFLLLQIAITTLLCFVPATSMIFTTLGVVCFGANWKTFILLFSGVFISSVIMDLIGRFGGSKLIIKLVGKEDYEKAVKLVSTKGVVYVPIMYLLPVFPDDAICMVCGALKVKWWVHYIEILLCRGIGCATIVFGLNLLPTELIDNLKSFNTTFIANHIFEYITMITIIAFWVYILLKLGIWAEKKIDSIKSKRVENEEKVEITKKVKKAFKREKEQNKL